MNITDLMSSGSVAIVGAADNRHYPRSIMRNLVGLGFSAERIFPVNPKHAQVLGLPCFPSLREVPGAVDLAVIATRRDTVPSLLSEAAERGVKAAVVLADGFSEQGTEGKELQARVAAIARDAGIALLGPNTLGFVSPETGLGIWAGGELPGQVRSGGVAMVFQSSGMLNLLLSLACDRHIGLRAGVSVGNEAVLDAADFIAHFAEDEKTSVIASFLETSIRPAKLVRALHRAQAAGKPVVMLKVGRSERARRNAVAHTGRMASSGKAWDAMLERLGVILVNDLDELIETFALFDHRVPFLPEGGMGIVTISGGDCSLLSDLAEQLAVPLPDINENTRNILVDALEKPTLLGNPLDCENLRREDPQRFKKCIDAFVSDPVIQVVAYRMNLAKETNESLKEMYLELLQKARNAGKMPVVLTRAFEPLDSEWFAFFEEQGVSFLPSYRTAMTALHHLFAWTKKKAGRLDVSFPQAVPETVKDGTANVFVLSWRDTQECLRQAGIPYAPAGLAGNARKAGEMAETIGYPVAAKLVSLHLPHKSEMNAVRLNLRSRQEVEAVCEEMLVRFQRVYPNKSTEGFEIQAMISGGTEVILGLSTDQTLGPILLVGMGGVFTEVMKDIVLAVPPLSPDEALDLIGKLKGSAILRGARGKPPGDLQELSRVISSFSRYIVEHKNTVREMDINPVIVLPEGNGVLAVDALIAIKEHTIQ